MIFLSLILSIQMVRADSAAEDAALKASQAWLDLVDSGKYDASWDEAAMYFKNSVKKEEWNSTIKAVRDPFGKLVKRTIKSKQSVDSMPGAPDGNYLIIQYDASFENKKSAVETVVTMLDKDGKWRVSGYYIR
jgi:Ethanolamine utilization protein EutJ (predicted chaperonin)